MFPPKKTYKLMLKKIANDTEMNRPIEEVIQQYETENAGLGIIFFNLKS